MTTRTSPSTKREHAARAARGALAAWCVLVLALAATALAWYLTRSSTLREVDRRFQTEIAAVRVDLTDRLRAYEQFLRGGVAVFHGWPSVTRGQWRSFVEHQQIAENYPGVQGIGFAEVIRPADLERHEREIRAEGFDDYRVWPEGDRELYTSIVYLEPFDRRNRRAFGYDMFQDPVRRAAMVRARDTGYASLSGRVTLMQETGEAVQPGFLMYLPVYETPSPQGIAERRRQLLGYVYSPFRMGDFMRGLLGERERLVALRVFDGDAPVDAALMHGTAAPEYFDAGRTEVSRTLDIGGRTWTLRVAALPALSADRAKPLIVAGGGLLVSVLLFAIARSLARNHAHATAANERLEQDIARRREAEAQLRDAEANFRFLFEKNPNPMWVFDRETLAILEVNDAAVAHYGYSRDEFTSLRISDLRHEEDVPDLLAYMESRQPGLRQAGEWRHITKDGRTIDVEVASYYLDFRQRPAALVVIRDVTESKRAEEALRDSEAMARGVLDSALDAYVRMNQEGLITEWNPMAERTFGRDRAKAIGQPLADLIIPADQRQAHRQGLARYLATGEGPLLNRRIEVQALRRDGEPFPVELTILAVEAGSGREFSAFLRDLTERREAEAQLRQAQRMEAVGQLTGGVAHDFNNLLTVIIGNLELAEPDEATGQALTAAEKGAALTHQLLAFSRQQTLNPVHTELNDVVQGMIDLLRRTLGEDIEIDVRLADDLWPELADKTQVESALLNLALNARDAMPDGGKLTVETGNVPLDEEYAAGNTEVTPGDYVLLAVTDTGTGMPPEVVERAFDPFFTTKEAGKGSGLGLSMIYGFAKQSGGHLKIYSEPGHGTTIRLYLPRAVSEEPVESAPRAPSGSERGSETILVVEDDDAVRKLVVRNLRYLGYSVLEAAHGEQAIGILRGSEPIDLLFTDVVLPGDTTGRQLAEEARALRPDVAVLFTSGYTQNSIVHQGRLDPGVQLLSKPYRRDDLARKIREVLCRDE